MVSIKKQFSKKNIASYNNLITKNIQVKQSINRINQILLLVFVITACIVILVFPSAPAEGAKTGIYFCANVLIPSLFPFMILSTFIIKSGLSIKLGKILEKPIKFLFNLPGCTGPTIIISLIGGYPIGARGVNALKKENAITNKQAQQMLCFSVGAGPAFIINVIGVQLLGSNQAGIIIFLSQIISSVIIGILVGRLYSSNKNSKNSNSKLITPLVQERYNPVNALIVSCKDATSGIINMSAFVILFSAMCNIINRLGINSIISNIIEGIGVNKNISDNIIPILLEVTGGCLSASKSGVPYELIAFALAWSGLCVHFQIYSSLPNVKFSTFKFIIFRLIHGILSALIAYIGFYLFPVTIQTMSTISQTPIACMSRDLPTFISLFFLCICFLSTINFKNIDLSENK